MVRTEKMKRHVWLVANHPTVVSTSGNMKEIAGKQINYFGIAQRRNCVTRNN
jgi:hypothetical protein